MARRYLEIDTSLEWLIEEAPRTTIQRGQNYFFQKRVSRIHFDDSIVTGMVHGTQWYRFTIDVRKQSAICECPAEYPCKHLVAAVYAISAQRRIHASSDSEEKSTESKKPEDFISELVLMIDSEFRYKFTGRNPDTGALKSISSFSEFLKLPDGQIIQPQSYDRNGRFLYFFHNHDFIERNEQYKLLPRYYIDGQPMKFCGEISLHCRLQKYPPQIQYAQTSLDDATGAPPVASVSDNAEFYAEFFYTNPDSGKEEIFYGQSFSTEAILSGFLILFKKYLPDNAAEGDSNKKIDHYEYYILRWANTMQQRFLGYQKGHLKLSVEGLLLLETKLLRAGFENVKDFIPPVFRHGPVATLSVYPEEGRRLKIRARWEFIYASNKKIIENDEMFSKVFTGKNSEKHLAKFDLVIKRIKNLKTYEKSANGNYAQLNVKHEQQIIFNLLKTAFYTGKKAVISLTAAAARDFVTEGAADLQSKGVKIQIHKSLARLLSEDNKLRVNFRISAEGSGVDWFGGQIEAGGMSLRELRAALKAYRKKEEFIKLKDGNWVSLDMIGLKGLMESFEKLGVKIRSDGSAEKITRGEALALTIEKESDMRTDTAVSDLKNRIRSLPETRKKHPKELRTSFKGILRDYQKEGIIFLESLYETGIGGILADDMGLGKTIQGLAFMSRLSEKKMEKGETILSLVVGPLASLSVWKKEAEKYFPDLPVTLWHGTGRTKTEFPKDGVLLTTYGTLLRDFEGWKNKHHFEVAILDEAQNLKNFRSLSSHAVRQTSVSVYFCLTGTPLENHLIDLWALFDICFPGYLGNRNGFLKYYAGVSLDGLRIKIAPFVLRRTKSEVLKELPPITETLVPVAMTERQRKFYEEARKIAIAELAIAQEDYLMVMLPHLMKLRRIACHPEAGNPEDAEIEASGKFQYLKDTLEELEETSSGILIFSQFTDILKICARLLDNLGYSYFYLDGKTPSSKRDHMVKNFQEGEKSFFLISLKAGGTALTLHRADTVIHLDPWWNPAVEKQASDRAHRIGQKKKVFVYKLYSENSIEEKVLELQMMKKEIFDALFGEKILATGKITRDQILKLLSE